MVTHVGRASVSSQLSSGTCINKAHEGEDRTKEERVNICFRLHVWEAKSNGNNRLGIWSFVDITSQECFENLKICFRRPFGDMTMGPGNSKEKHAVSFGEKRIQAYCISA